MKTCRLSLQRIFSDLMRRHLSYDKRTIPTISGIYVVNGSRKELATLMRFNRFPPDRFSPAALAESGRFLSQMHEITEDRVACDRVKNEYEGCIYRVKGRLEFDTNFRLVITDEEREKIAEEINTHQAWFEGAEPAQASLSTFQDRPLLHNAREPRQQIPAEREAALGGPAVAEERRERAAQEECAGSPT
jgi:hypothetical protein